MMTLTKFGIREWGLGGVVTLAVLIIVSLRKKREDQPPASLGLSFFREER